jgi:hypothetical protein
MLICSRVHQQVCSEIGELDVITLLFLDGSLQLLFLRMKSLSPASYILPLFSDTKVYFFIEIYVCFCQV